MTGATHIKIRNFIIVKMAPTKMTVCTKLVSIVSIVILPYIVIVNMLECVYNIVYDSSCDYYYFDVSPVRALSLYLYLSLKVLIVIRQLNLKSN